MTEFAVEVKTKGDLQRNDTDFGQSLRKLYRILQCGNPAASPGE
jgi:hypothetical protein